MVWLTAIAVVLVAKNAFCNISLDMPHQVKGARGRSVIIPCTYEPSDQYVQKDVLWFFGSKLVFNRISSEDHILLAEYRNRVSVSKTPGDVSLTLSNLKKFDRGDYKCRVTWKSNAYPNQYVTKELISSLAVLNEPIATEKPKVILTTRSQSKSTTKPIATEKPKVHMTTKVPSTSATRTFKQESVTSAASTTKFLQTMNRDDNSHQSKITQSITNNAELGTIVTGTFKQESVTSAASTTKFLQTMNHDDNSHHSEITQPITNNAEFGAIVTGSGIPLYIILIIGSICILLVVILIIVLTIKRKNKKGYDVGMLTMNQLVERADAASANVNNCQSCASQAPRAVNDYEVQHEHSENGYQSITFRNDNEYELLLSEKENNI